MTLNPAFSDAHHAKCWQANIQLGFSCRHGRTILSENRHQGPLRVQKALYPEGNEVCQALLLHPPSGIAGGDHLAVSVHVGQGAHAQMTTPGAGKWYRSAGAEASQICTFTVEERAILEWLPQETIVFDGAKSRMTTRVELQEGAHYVGWEIVCLGRAASGEHFQNGLVGLHTRLERNGVPLWLERGHVSGHDPMLESMVGWAGRSVNATLLATLLPHVETASLLDACRAILPVDGADHALTVLPGVLVARYLGDNSEAARLWLTALWQMMRPALLGRQAVIPRIWNT